MKKISTFITLAVFILVTLQLKAQDSRNMVGGTLGFGYSGQKPVESTSKTNQSNTTHLSASPVFGYLIGVKSMIGLALEVDLIYTKYNGKALNEQIQKEFLITPFVRYYANESFFIQGQLNYGNSYSVISGENYDVNTGYIPFEYKSQFVVYGWGFGLGYDFKLADHILLEPLIQYNSNFRKDRESDQDYTNSDILFNLGMFYNF